MGVSSLPVNLIPLLRPPPPLPPIPRKITKKREVWSGCMRITALTSLAKPDFERPTLSTNDPLLFSFTAVTTFFTRHGVRSYPGTPTVVYSDNFHWY